MNCTVDVIHGYGRTGQQDGEPLGREDGQISIVKTRTRDGQVDGNRLCSLGVKTKGKAREIIAMISRCVKARLSATTRRTEASSEREDKACKTSDPAHSLGQEGGWTASIRSPIKGRDSGRGAKTRHLRDDLEVRDTGTGTARLTADGQLRSPQPVLQDQKSEWFGGRRSTKGLTVRGGSALTC
ncbi:hypothetical protein CF326_g3183 [Tilletia indica]|nr:hypothetical protein CF326_g3183 [Tilletia indica]